MGIFKRIFLAITCLVCCINCGKTEGETYVLKDKVIVVDAGHGGIDKGTIGTFFGTEESEINLAISTALKSELEKYGFEVVMTREDENGLYGTTEKGHKRRDMQKRKEIIDNANPDLVISIHCNSATVNYRNGMSVYYDKDDEEGKRFAKCLEERSGELGLSYFKVFAEKFYMTHEISFPSVIFECGFLTNKEEEQKLNDKDYQAQIARMCAESVFDYFITKK